MDCRIVPIFAWAAAISALIRLIMAERLLFRRMIPCCFEKQPMNAADAPLLDHTSDPPDRVTENRLNSSTFIATEGQKKLP